MTTVYKETGTPRAGHDIMTLKVNLYYESKGKWTQFARLPMYTFEVILKAKKEKALKGQMTAWIAESILAYDYRPVDLKKSLNSLVDEMTRYCEEKLGAPVRGITKMMISQSYL